MAGGCSVGVVCVHIFWLPHQKNIDTTCMLKRPREEDSNYPAGAATQRHTHKWYTIIMPVALGICIRVLPTAYKVCLSLMARECHR